MALDHELPVWGIRPNWADPLIETLTWQTDVLRSLSGAEQRLALRLAPRRMIEARYNPHESERTFADLVMHRLGRSEWMMPLWFDSSRLSAQAVAATTRIDCETQYREFVAGGMAYLVGPDTFSGEAVRINTVDSTGLDLDAPLEASWPAGTTIHPMRRGWFEDTDARLLTSRLAETNIRFEIIEGNDLSDEGVWETAHTDGIPVLTRDPDWSQDIQIDLSWLGDTFDSGVGQKIVTDTAGRAFRQQAHSFIVSGAQERFELRQMIYRLRGQQKPVWLPTSADDVEIAVAANAGAGSIDVRRMGLSYIGGPTDGRDHLYFSGGQIAQISNAAIVGGTDHERLTLAQSLSANKLPGDRASFIERARLAQDSVEIEHLGDTDGVARSTLSFTGYSERRVATSAAQPIPAASEEVTACGLPAEVNSCNAFNFFEGWYYRVILTMPGNSSRPDSGSIIMGLGAANGGDQGGSLFYQNSDMQFDPNVVGTRQYHVSPDRDTVIVYFSVDRGPAIEVLLQMQRLGVGGNAQTLQFQTWDSGLSTLATRQSEYWNPGDNTDVGNGLTGFDGEGGFPNLYYFGV